MVRDVFEEEWQGCKSGVWLTLGPKTCSLVIEITIHARPRQGLKRYRPTMFFCNHMVYLVRRIVDHMQSRTFSCMLEVFILKGL